MSDSALGVGLKARPDSSAVEHLTFKVKGHEFEPRITILYDKSITLNAIFRMQYWSPGLYKLSFINHYYFCH